MVDFLQCCASPVFITGLSIVRLWSYWTVTFVRYGGLLGLQFNQQEYSAFTFKTGRLQKWPSRFAPLVDKEIRPGLVNVSSSWVIEWPIQFSTSADVTCEYLSTTGPWRLYTPKISSTPIWNRRTSCGVRGTDVSNYWISASHFTPMKEICTR